ncbi:hypothetical protein FRC07_000898 [Ceratobasidium sp. 392]|nr:hypothetical protein FRC07_000898 [Ceratobasidium sp. 392]
MVPPIGIRYYQLSNHGDGTMIWHKLQGLDGSVVGNARKQGCIGSLNPATSWVLDLFRISTGGQAFLLSEDTHLGSEHADTSSNLIATAVREGTTHNGRVTYTGMKEYTSDMLLTQNGSLVVAGVTESAS